LFHYAHSGFIALLQVILIDITMAGDNAVVIGMAAARVGSAYRRVVIFRGLAIAVVLRVVLASFAMTLLNQLGLTLAGGILLLWVSWRIWRDIAQARGEAMGLVALKEKVHHIAPDIESTDKRRLIMRAVLQIVLADASMSLDNVLAVAGAAQGHYWVLVLGLLLSIALMGIAVTYVAQMLRRHPWISYAGLFIVIYVAVTMILQGWTQVAAHL